MMQEEFSRMLKSARKEAGLTQKALAEILGVATGTVQQWELGIRFPRVGMLKQIEKTLKIAIVPSEVEQEKKDNRNETLAKAWKAAEQKAGRKLSFDEAMEYFKFDVSAKMKLEAALSKLNNEGVKVALERIEELTLIDKYTLPVIPKNQPYFDSEKYVLVPVDEQPTPAETPLDGVLYPEGYTDTTKEEKPPEGENKPNDGK